MSSTEVLDGSAMSAARARLATAPDGPAALGALGELAVWAAGTQSRCPPRPFANPVLVVVAADHGISAGRLGSDAQESTAASVARLRSGGGTAGLLAPPHLHVLDAGVDDDDLAGAELRVRRGSGSIDTEDALTAGEALRAFASGRLLVDQLVDSGADLLLVGNVGAGSAIPAAVLAAAVTGTEPIAVVPPAAGDNQRWIRTVTVVRDALHRSAMGDQQPLTLLARVGGADVAAATGVLVQAAQRRTPVLLDGPVAMVAALMAEIYAGGASAWWQAASSGQHPAQALAVRTLDLTPILDMGLAATDGAGALLALPLLQAAINLLDGLQEAPNRLLAAWTAAAEPSLGTDAPPRLEASPPIALEPTADNPSAPAEQPWALDMSTDDTAASDTAASDTADTDTAATDTADTDAAHTGQLTHSPAGVEPVLPVNSREAGEPHGPAAGTEQAAGSPPPQL